MQNYPAFVVESETFNNFHVCLDTSQICVLLAVAVKKIAKPNTQLEKHTMIQYRTRTVMLIDLSVI